MNEQQILDVNKHISNVEILQDIADTRREIEQFQDKIDKRRLFIQKLKDLLLYRTEGWSK